MYRLHKGSVDIFLKEFFKPRKDCCDKYEVYEVNVDHSESDNETYKHIKEKNSVKAQHDTDRKITTNSDDTIDKYAL